MYLVRILTKENEIQNIISDNSELIQLLKKFKVTDVTLIENGCYASELLTEKEEGLEYGINEKQVKDLEECIPDERGPDGGAGDDGVKKFEPFFNSHIKEHLFLSKCCESEIEDITGSYASDGQIYAGYSCKKCGKHLYKEEHLILNKK